MTSGVPVAYAPVLAQQGKGGAGSICVVPVCISGIYNCFKKSRERFPGIADGGPVEKYLFFLKF